MSDTGQNRIVSPLERLHFVGLGAALVGPFVVIWTVAAMGDRLTAKFSDIAFLNWILKSTVLMGYQTIFLYFLAIFIAIPFLITKTVGRYATNSPYPDRDRPPQLMAIGLAFGLAFFLTSYAKTLMANKFWDASGPPIYKIWLTYLFGSIVLFFSAWLLLRWLLVKIPKAKRKKLRYVELAFFIICLFFLMAGQALPQIRGDVIEATSAPPADAPNIVLITIDTLRADKLEPYGAKEISTPAAKRMASEGTLFANAYSTSPWTGPSFASIHSGHYPNTLRLKKICTLLGDYPTLAAHLAAGGYRTEAVITNPFLRPELSFDRGFQYFEHTSDPKWLQPVRGSTFSRSLVLWMYNSYKDYRAEIMTDRANKRLKSLRDRNEKFFLWVHYMDPHLPYITHDDDTLALGSDYQGPYSKMFWDFRSVRNGSVTITDADRNQIRKLYEQDVAHGEKHIARLLDTLDELGLTNDTAVIYVSDHGEELFDHGSVEHGHTLFDELIHVPLIIRWPGKVRAANVNENPASIIDLFPTICAMAGLAPPEQLPGINLLQDHLPPDRTLFVENLLYGPQRKAMIKNRVKFSHDPHGAPEFMFMLEQDPREKQNVLDQHPNLVEAMHEEFKQWKIDIMQLSDSLIGDMIATIDLPPDLKSQLFSVGYIVDE